MRENYDQQILRSTQHLAVYVAVLLCRRGKGEKVIGWGLPHRVRQGADERLSISTLARVVKSVEKAGARISCTADRLAHGCPLRSSFQFLFSSAIFSFWKLEPKKKQQIVATEPWLLLTFANTPKVPFDVIGRVLDRLKEKKKKVSCTREPVALWLSILSDNLWSHQAPLQMTVGDQAHQVRFIFVVKFGSVRNYRRRWHRFSVRNIFRE